VTSATLRRCGPRRSSATSGDLVNLGIDVGHDGIEPGLDALGLGAELDEEAFDLLDEASLDGGK
jgi:hypothetical protein